MHVQVKRRGLVSLFDAFSKMGLRPVADSVLPPSLRDQHVMFQSITEPCMVAPELLASLGAIISGSELDSVAASRELFYKIVSGMHHLRIAALREKHAVCASTAC